ncbi:hypothetical protein IWQ62_003965 [Dispira parvispora]|uniref:Metaxin n=1 Tax=Dispira parvispora TaxID=1520584 RepID=A0A9W8AT83_9FUNG|nr:hypothetical protein IWQ62_003965 [Dispira parvispora]
MLVLYCWGAPPTEGAPCSIDLDSLCVLNYLRLSDSEWSVSYCTNSRLSPDRTLPFIEDDGMVVSGLPRILEYLKRQGHDLDSHQEPSLELESRGLMAATESILRDVLLYTWFFDTDNYVHDTRKAWASLTTFPYSLYLPMQKRQGALTRLAALRRVDESILEAQRPKERADNAAIRDEVPEIVKRLRKRHSAQANSVFSEHMVELAKGCFTQFASRLEHQEYLGGAQYTTADIFFHAYLTLQLYPFSWQHNPIRDLLQKEFSGLLAYHQRMDQVLGAAPLPAVHTTGPPTFYEVLWGLGSSLVHQVSHPTWWTAPALRQEGPSKPEDDIFTPQHFLHNVYSIVGTATVFFGYLIVNQFLGPTIPNSEHLERELVLEPHTVALEDEDSDDGELDDDDDDYEE